MKLIASDPGKTNTKAFNGSRYFIIPTKFEETDRNDFTEKTYHMEWNGHKYLIGEGVEDYDTTKKKLQHKLAFYLSIANLVNNDDEVKIITGCPISVFLNSKAKEEYKQYLFEDMVVELKVNGKPINFAINDIIVLPESIGIIYQNPIYYKDKLVAVVDIGGLNTNAAIYEHLKPIKESAFTINEGGMILQNKIKLTLNSKFGLNYQDYEIPYVIRDGVIYEGQPCKEGSQLMDEIMRTHLEGIIKAMK